MYEVVDLESFNVAGRYPNQDVALLMVLETIKHSGDEAALTLSLGIDDPTGQTDGELIAQGPELIALARARYLFSAPALA